YQYYGTPKKSQLTSIQECTNNGRCLPKTKFRWSNKETSFGVNGKQWQANLGGDGNWKNRPTHIADDENSLSMLIDINGDGLPDRVFDRNPSNDQQGFYVFLNTGNGFDSGKQWQSDLGGHSNWKNRPISNSIRIIRVTIRDGWIARYTPYIYSRTSRLIDINGDGLPDRVFDRNPSNDQPGFYVFLNTGNGFDSGKQWQSNLGGDENWKNRTTYKNGEHSMLIDINGDGLPDRVFDHNPGTNQKGLFVYLNTGNGFDNGKQWQSNLGGSNDWKNRPTHENGEHSMLIDINGDGLPDRVFDRNPKTDQQGLFVYLNTGDGFDNGKQWQANLGGDESPWKNRPTHENGEYSMLIDINGDGLPDRVFDRNPKTNQTGLFVYLNTGNGFDSGKQWQSNLGGDENWKNRTTYINGEHSMLIDINGDGLPDRVFDHNPETDQKGLFVYLNTGDGFDNGKQWQSNLGGSNDWKNRPTHENGERSMLIDINGDGLLDRVFDRNPKTDQQGFFVYSKPYKTPRLKVITNGFGIQTTLNYKPLTDSSVYTKGPKKGYYPNISIQNARQVISSVTTDNAIGGQNTTTYKYGNAKVNVKGRGNLGFGWIEKKDLQSNKLTRTEYSQTYPYTGQTTATKEYIEAKNTIEANNTRQLLNEQINTYRDKSHYNKVHSPYLHRSKERSYDFNASDASSNSPLITVVTSQSNIDNYGNVGTIRISTTGNNKIFSKVTKNTYSNDTTNWHLGRLSKAKVTHNAANTPSITRTSSFTYNSDGLLKSETIAPNTNKSLTTTYEYDSFGNKTKSTVTGSGIVSRSTTVEYSTDGKFPVKTTNALGHSETKTFDTKTGNVLTLTGPNGLTTTWEYDALGRQAKETRADGTTTTTNYEWWKTDANQSDAGIVYKVTTTTSGSSPKITYFDAFNRKTKEQHTGFDGRKIISDIHYDDLGRVKQASLPYFEDEQRYFVTTEYDAIGRLISTTKPSDEGKTATSSTSYNGLSTTTTNALGHKKTTTKNIIGKVIRIDEPKGAWLTHHYDSIGNLIK
ncbi:Rhs family protein, partial [uncultured Gammaproteobacteria bacterium]